MILSVIIICQIFKELFTTNNILVPGAERPESNISKTDNSSKMLFNHFDSLKLSRCFQQYSNLIHIKATEITSELWNF